MALRYGFYNSIDHDRVYDADEFSAFLDGIVYDGVYQAVGDCFFVEPQSGMKITVGTGRAWFNRTWTWNETKIQLTVPPSHTALPRKDAVIIEVNKRDRRNYIKILQGEAASTPKKPTLKNEYPIYQHALAYITVNREVTVIQKANIENVVGSSQTPFCSALALSGIPSGGKIGQVLAKESDESGAVGWHDIGALPHGTWYLAEGLSENNVIAAYKFYHVPQAQGLIPVNDIKSGRNLTIIKYQGNSPVNYDSSYGILLSPGFGGLANDIIASSNPQTIIVRFSEFVDRNNKGALLSGFYNDGPQGNYHELYLRMLYQYDNESAGSGWKSSRTIGVNLGNQAWNTTEEGEHANKNALIVQDLAPIQGIIGVSYIGHNDAKIYFDGIGPKTTSNPGDANVHTFPNTFETKLVIGSQGAAPYSTYLNDSCTYKVQYVAFYNTVLTDAQHSSIAAGINYDMTK